MRIASISGRACGSFLSSVEELHGPLGEPLHHELGDLGEPV
jgi:hypothetical protein